MGKERHSHPADSITKAVIGCAYEVANELGHGFLEKVYENALAYEVRRAGLKCIQQQPIKVRYKKVVVGDFFADLLVDDRVVVELKAAGAIDPAHVAQCLNYLKAAGMKVCLLINFGPRSVQIKRLIAD